jgi:ankyrin repeat protein
LNGVGLTDIARLLIERGVNVDATDNYGRSVLSRAVELGLTDIARMLIKGGAKVSARDRQNVHANTEESK